MGAHQEQLAHLELLSAELTREGLTTQLTGSTSARPRLKVANASTPQLNERVHVQQADDGTWIFCWPWNQPIGPVTDLATVTTKISAVLRTVEDEPAQPAASPQASTNRRLQEC
jgi:hypothetical protein